MKRQGNPFTIEGTDSDSWLVTWPDAINGNGENMSFTVAIPRGPNLTIEEVQAHALKRAQELLRLAIAATRSQDPD